MTTDATTHGGVRESIYTTELVPPQERRNYWRQALSQAFGTVDISVPTDAYCGTVRTASLGRLRAVTVEGDGMALRRSHRTAAGEDEEECVVLKLLDAGVAQVEQDGRKGKIQPGDIFVYDTTRPVRLDLPRSFRIKSLVLPRGTLGLRDTQVNQITASPFRPDSSLGWLLSPFITRLVDDAAAFPPHTHELMALNAVDLLGTLADEWVSRTGAQVQEKPQSLLLRVQSFIDEELADPALSPAHIARVHHISLRYLHKLFQAEGISVSRWILQRRLEACRRDLLHHQMKGLTIAAVAHQRGFASAAHFSRSFRAAYGVSPSEWRKSQQPSPDQPDDGAGL
ncbi:helix-turn-helix domain-containing protein [Streptomyces sp. TRM S81-3]|uniref:Helix-turn-helix domain-containing protein n=1 Tax=Streptomyces griseicoloratus TaxID=2752516 RepID=A0A926QPM8_9ACTN|nr:helix-turn-helix domain-containing protein [Streptomyces griseicoloratus]MBD0418192.1 helix-turn-helix domain-containing protein [Streptomyces griseicoloratus]